ncbi:regulatory particle non-atpase 13 [Stylonychia lemnae]|uniref:Regulatory particle non-atpase 13 n=1 Tax=Stylonychia lemnae TaxID=5949 RepID=A0A078AHV0_STYLE|nr:regulatory particle non-atpase 13 [Stylonychia lemnae]|eukprot:CDW81082.1 regulatory particle non-atpase 13 [Stylonychia lemnae]
MMAPQVKALVEFKAGKMTFDGKMVKPDRRRGIIKIVADQSGMKQFQLLDADTKTQIESFYVFPGDAKFEKVKQSKDRVYLLEFSSTSQRHFYWMQEADKDKDQERATQVHNTLNNIQAAPATQTQAQSQPTTASGQRTGPSMQSQNAQQQPRANANPSQFDDLMSQLLQSMGQGASQFERSPGLANILTTEGMLKLIEENPDVRQALIEQLPEGQQDEQGLKDNILSPQLRQALGSLTQAIQSDQISIILGSLGLDQSVLNNSKDGVEALINALIKRHSKKD